MNFYKSVFWTGVLFLLFSCYSKNRKSLITAGAAVQIDSLPGNCPYLTKDKNGNVVMSWARSVNDSVAVFCYAVSTDGGKSFGKITTIPSSDNIHLNNYIVFV